MKDVSIKQRLLKAAERLFAEKGFAAVSIREIADAAHANSSMIFYYFCNKQGLYQAVIEDKLELLRQALSPLAVPSEQPEAVFSAYALIICRLHAQSPFFTKLFCRELQQPSDLQIIKDVVRFVREVLLEALNAGVKQGIFRHDLNLRHCILFFVGAVNFYFCAQPLLKGVLENADEAEEYVRAALAFFLESIRITENENK